MEAEERVLEAALLERLDELGRRVACAGEGACELRVHRLDAVRGRDAVGLLARDVQPVLLLLEHVEHSLVVERTGIAGEPLELGQRPREPGPEGAHLSRVALSDSPRRCHNRMLLPGDRIRSPAVAQQASVLVVEDDPSLRLLARVNLELERFRVREAGTLEEARAAVAAEAPALVFLDVHLHGESDRRVARGAARTQESRSWS